MRGAPFGGVRRRGLYESATDKSRTFFGSPLKVLTLFLICPHHGPYGGILNKGCREGVYCIIAYPTDCVNRGEIETLPNQRICAIMYVKQRFWVERRWLFAGG